MAVCKSIRGGTVGVVALIVMLTALSQNDGSVDAAEPANHPTSANGSPDASTTPLGSAKDLASQRNAGTTTAPNSSTKTHAVEANTVASTAPSSSAKDLASKRNAETSTAPHRSAKNHAAANSPQSATAPHLHECFVQLQNRRPDRANACLTPLLVHVCRKGFRDETNREVAARYLTLMARTLIFDENLAAAQQCYFLAHQLDPENTFAIYALADVWERTGRSPDASKLVARMLRDATRDPLAAHYAVRYYMRAGMAKKARETAVQALQLENGHEDWISHQGAGRCYAREGNTAKAIEEYKIAAKQVPDGVYSKIARHNHSHPAAIRRRH